MSASTLPPRASLEFLRKLAKDRLADLRKANPRTQLAAALLAVAHEHGFSSWRALKTEVDSRHATSASRFFEAIAKRDADTVRALLREEPSLIRARHPRHDASALHHASCDLDTTRVLLDAGADPNDAGDDAHIGVIGWATMTPPNGEIAMDVVALLIERGARPPREASGAARPATSELAQSIKSTTLVVGAKDVAATLAWYTSIGFTETARYPTDGIAVFWGKLTCGEAELTFDVREPGGAREFSIRDPNGFTLRFLQNAR